MSIHPLIALGDAKRKAKDFQAAVQRYQEILHRNPADPRAIHLVLDTLMAWQGAE